MTAVVVTGPAAGTPLVEALGAQRWAAVRDVLVGHATAWAQEVAPGRVTLTAAPELAAAVAAAFEAHGGPLLIAAAEAPRLTAAHADMALSDLTAGADATFGPAMDGGWYLAGLRAPHPQVVDLLAGALDGREVMGRALAAAHAANLEVGLLRMERLLRTPQDAVALRIDPLVPAPVRQALGG